MSKQVKVNTKDINTKKLDKALKITEAIHGDNY